MSLINVIRKLHIAAVVKTHKFIKEEKGAAGIEYAIVATLVAVALVGFAGPISTEVKSIFSDICTAIGSQSCPS
ncbi:Flp family type IVb pilin [Pseudomonas sp. NPDC078700]|uniref:Flp family type IVb pilin n=1 Tax=Pseudomonas sp. NPDC078700 TaxID=3364424 RepID=UPI0037CAA90B